VVVTPLALDWVETGVTYDGDVPVRVRVRKRDGRYDFSDDGGAVRAAGVDVRHVAMPRTIALGPYSVNVNGRGVVWLPATSRTRTDWLARLPGIVTEGSLALYEALLESAD
jgi:hypothetical protein